MKGETLHRWHTLLSFRKNPHDYNPYNNKSKFLLLLSTNIVEYYVRDAVRLLKL